MMTVTLECAEQLRAQTRQQAKRLRECLNISLAAVCRGSAAANAGSAAGVRTSGQSQQTTTRVHPLPRAPMNRPGFHPNL